MSSLVGLSLTTLKRKAREAAESRGHTLAPFERSDRRPNDVAYTSCKVCGAHLTVNAHPGPNEIEIMGGVVAIDCTKVQTPIARKG